MSRRRRILISAFVVAACIAVVLGVLVILPPRPGVTKANFDRITDETTLAEVELLFGCECDEPGWKWNDKKTIHTFVSEDGYFALIAFDSQAGQVIRSSCMWTGSSESLPDKLRRWLHLPK